MVLTRERERGNSLSLFFKLREVVLMDRKTIGFIGAGNMAFAIAGGIPNPVCLYDRNAKAYEKFIGDRYTVCESISELVNASNLIV